MNKIIVTGANGQLGHEIKTIASSFNNYQFFFFERTQLNITDASAVEKTFQEISPAFIINCAAYTAVDKAETEKETAFMINAIGVQNLSRLSKKFGSKFIHISTDYVFPGNGKIPYGENAPTSPINAYGASKAAGEQLALDENDEAIIIRTSWVYSYYGNNFVKTMLRLMQSKSQIYVVGDQLGSPTYAADLAEAIKHIITSKKWIPGIYHYSNSGIISWFEFAKAIKELSEFTTEIHPITTDQYPTPAKRPSYSALDTSRIKEVYGIEIKPWKDSLKRCLNKLIPAK